MMFFGQVESLTQGLAGNGPAWTLVAILIALSWTLIKLLLAEKDKRIQDAKDNQNNLVAPVNKMSEAIERLEQKVRVAKGE
jgi:hypothetical protein